MAGTPFLLAMVLAHTTILYSDLKFSLNDPIINQNLLSYLNDRQDLVDYLSSHSSNSADTTIGSSSEYYRHLCQQASKSLKDRVVSGLEAVPELAQEARAEYLSSLMESNLEAAVGLVTYALGFAGIFLGQLLGRAEATSFPYSTIGYVIQDLGYTYEYVVELKPASEDCTTGLVINTYESPATYGSLMNEDDNDGIIPELYWVQTASVVEDVRSTLSCLSDSALETQLRLVEKAGKLRTKLLKEKEAIQIY